MTNANPVPTNANKAGGRSTQQSTSPTVSANLRMDEKQPLKGERILVTGGEGFIGSHLTESLVSAGALVTVVDRIPTSEIQNLKPLLGQIEYFHQELVQVDFDALLSAHEYRSVFHLAGGASVPASVQNPWADFQSNAVGGLKLLESLRRNPRPTRLILASSAAVYGDTRVVPICEDTALAPLSPYGVSKLTLDRYAAVYAQVYGLRTASLRPFAVYGPRLRKQVVYDFINRLTTDSSCLEAHGDGTQVRDFCYVSDVVEAALTVERSGQLRGEVYNVASGQGVSICNLVGQLSEQLGIQPTIRWSGHVRPGEPEHWIADITRLAALGWTPSVSLRLGLSRTIDWFRSCHE